MHRRSAATLRRNWAIAGALIASLLAACQSPPAQRLQPAQPPQPVASTDVATVALSTYASTDGYSKRVARDLGEALPAKLVESGKVRAVREADAPAELDMEVEVRANLLRSLSQPLAVFLNLNEAGSREPESVLFATVTVTERASGALVRRFEVNSSGPYPPGNSVADNMLDGIDNAVDLVAERIAAGL